MPNTCSCGCTSTQTTCTSCGCQTNPFLPTSRMSWSNIDNVPFDYSQIPIPVIVEVSEAEIKALFTTPKSLIEALGPNKVINFYGAYSVFTQGGANYTNANAINIRYTGQTNPVLTIPATHITTTSKSAKFTPATASDDNFAANVGLELYTPVANPTVGTGTMIIYLFYTELILTT